MYVDSSPSLMLEFITALCLIDSVESRSKDERERASELARDRERKLERERREGEKTLDPHDAHSFLRLHHRYFDPIISTCDYKLKTCFYC